jgi:hypothetical protein
MINRYLGEQRLCSVVENKLRVFISEMIQPFSEKVVGVQNQITKLSLSSDMTQAMMQTVNQKLDRE